MTLLNFAIPGEPCGKGRPRFYNGRAITPTKTRNYEALVQYIASQAYKALKDRPDFDAPCAVEIDAYYPIPQSYSRKKKNACAQDDVMQVRPGKPDIDNLQKAILDGMNGIVFRDDVQVVSIQARKHWAIEQPRVDVRVAWDK